MLLLQELEQFVLLSPCIRISILFLTSELFKNNNTSIVKIQTLKYLVE